jgi:hypothetical protein
VISFIQNNRAVRIYGDPALFGGISSSTTYYINAIVGTTLSLSTSSGGSALTLTATTAGVNTLYLWSPDEYPGTNKPNVNNETWAYVDNVATWPPSSCSNCNSYSASYAAAVSSGLATTTVFIDEVRLSLREDCAVASKNTPAAVELVYSVDSISAKRWKAVSLGWDHSCATDTTSTLYCWGRNQEGQVGDGSITDVSRPRPVVNLPAGVLSFSLGRFHTCAVAGGSLYCWGAFSTTSSTINYGQTASVGSLVALRINGISASIRQVVCGKVHTCALDSNSMVWCFGRNLYGQLGSGSSTNTASPSPVLGIPHAVTALSTGIKGESTCAITLMQQRWCWGENNFGQLGDGTGAGRHDPVGGVSALVRIEPSGIFSVRNGMRMLVHGANSFGVSPYKVCNGVQLLDRSNSSFAFDLTCSWLEPSVIEGKTCFERFLFLMP